MISTNFAFFNMGTSKIKSGFNFDFVGSRKFQLVWGSVLLFFSFFLFFSFISYLSNGAFDQSVVEDFTGDIKENSFILENTFGLMGATFSHLFIYSWFGLGAFLIPPLFFLLGFKVLFRRSLFSLPRVFAFAVFHTIWISILLGYLVVIKDSPSQMGMWCGGVGFELSTIFDSLIGSATSIFIILLFLTFNMFFFNVYGYNSLKERLGRVYQFRSTLKEKIFFRKKHQEEEKIESMIETIKREVEDEGVDDEPKTNSETSQTEEPSDHQSEDNELVLEVVKPNEADDTTKKVISSENYDSKLDLPKYKFPKVQLLKDYGKNNVEVSELELEQNKKKITETLINFKIGIASIKATIGPTVTLYEIVPEAGVKISKIKNLEDDIALSLSALGIRIIAPIPGKGTIGIEVPNKNRKMVDVKSVIASKSFMQNDYELPIALGRTISNEVFVADLSKMPHLLMAGATGQGKSVGLNMILTSLLYKKHPSQLKFVLVDPKKVELTLFNKIEKHFLAKLPDSEEAIITDTSKVVNTLQSLCSEMDKRYDLLKLAGCRNLKEYNAKFVSRRLNPEKGHRFLPYIVLIIDELADLMMTAGKEVETPIARLAQLARAIGIHLIVATQRPSVNVITGVIKANFPARLSFRVTSKIDSRTILDTGGADQLVGMGDMLLSTGSELIRLQCGFVDTPEVESICSFIGDQQGYDDAYLLPEYVGNDDNSLGEVDLSDRDALFEDAARLIVLHQQGSTSLIQRKMKLGYNRAGRLIDQLEAAGIVGSFEGSKAREVLIPDEISLEQLLQGIK